MYYEDVFRELNKRKVRYLVVGGIAVNLYGVPRVTMDLDLMVEMERENLLRFVDALERVGYKPRVHVKATALADPAKRKEWQKKKHMVAFSFYRPELPYQQVDIFLDNPIDFEEASRTRELIAAEGIRIPLISLENLIKLKRELGREQDLSDVEALKKARRILRGKRREKR